MSEPGKPSSPADRMRARRLGKTAASSPTTPKEQGEWFQSSRIGKPDDPTAMETMVNDQTREEAKRYIESLAHDPSFVTGILERASDVVSQLPDDYGRQARRAEEMVRKAAENLGTIDAAEKQRLVNEVMAAITDRTPLSALKDTNALAEQMIAQGALEVFETEANITTEAKLKKIDGPKPHTGMIKGGLVLALAVGTYLLEIGATKTAATQFLEVYNKIPLVQDGIQLIADMLKGKGMSANDALSQARFIVGSTFALTVGGLLFTTKGIGWDNLSKKGKVTLLTTLGLSLGMGGVALINYVTDVSDVATIGGVAEEKFKGPREQAMAAKADREKLYKDLPADITQAVNAEINDPKRPGYASWSAFIDGGLNGTFDQKRLDDFIAANPGKKADILRTHKQLQDTLDRLRKDLFPDGKGGFIPGKGLMDIARQEIDLDTAPKLIDAVVTIGKAAKQTTFYSGMWHVLSPVDNTPTSLGIYNQAKEAAEAFDSLIRDDKSRVPATRVRITKWLDGMIAASRGNADMTKSLTNLKQTLLKKLQPLTLPTNLSETIMKEIQKPTGRWTIVPDDLAWRRIQSSIKDAAIFKQVGWDVQTESPYRPFWQAGIIILLGGFFLTINGISMLGSGAINRSRKHDFEGAVAEGAEDLNEREAFLADAVARTFEKAMRQFALNSNDPLLQPIPRSLIALHVRRHLREKYISEKITEPEWRGWFAKQTQRAGWFLHGLGLGKTPEDARLFLNYNKWLEDKLAAFDKDAPKEMERIVGDLYPEYNKVIVANNEALEATGANRPEAERRLGSELQRARSIQLKKFATLIQERLAVLDIVPTPDLPPEVIKDGSIRINPDSENINVSRDLAMAAYAARNTIGEREWLERTLHNLRQQGIVPEKTVSDRDELVIGKFSLGPKFAVQDQLMRIRASQEVGIISAEGNAEDFERFDRYMTDVAKALKGIRDNVLSKDPDLKGPNGEEFYVDFVWKKTEGGYYTMNIDLYADRNLLGTPAATLTYTQPIPDFDPKKTSKEVIDTFVRWMRPGSPAIQGLIAQQRHTFYKQEHARLLAEVKKARGDGPQVSEAVLVSQGTKTPPQGELRKKLTDAYYLSELIDEQVGSIALAKRGVQLEQGKFRAFLSPKQYMSDRRTGVDLERYLDDLFSRDYPDDITIKYIASSRTFVVSKTSSRLFGLGGQREQGEPIRIPARQYRIETLERALQQLASR